ncbi:MAG: hypothetical protein E6Q25_04205 [Acinetobacter sp.]|jgi:uncharacterized membrane protein|nr:MAG: hypothetical protein E6Q25_04205 [Acinetobacter sp.]
MPTFLLTDQLNQLHWMMLKSILMILAILPMSHGLLDLLAQTEGSSQIIIGFFSLSIISASVILAFLTALHATTWQCEMIEHKAEQRIFKLYRQLPMLFLTVILISMVQGM